MKNKAVLLVVVWSMMVCAAQMMGQTGSVKVTVPFPFTAGDRQFLAGDYTITATHDNTVTLSRTGAKEDSLTVITHLKDSGPNVQNPKLVFRSYDNVRFLSEIWLTYSDLGREMAVTSHERELAKSATQKKTILLALR